jgi:hypothetical protein
LAFAEPQPAIAVASSLQRQRYEEKTTPANLNAKKARKKARCHFFKHFNLWNSSYYVINIHIMPVIVEKSLF